MAIEPESAAERKKLSATLEMLKRQDPTFRAGENEETGQTLISGMGELHLEVIKHRLLREFNLDVKVHKPRVSYRETMEHAARGHGRVPSADGRASSCLPGCRSRMEPAPDGSRQPRCSNLCSPDDVPPSAC